MGRRIAMTDIHGCFTTFRKMVEDNIGLNKSDELFLLGDFIDRGKRTKELIQYIIDIQSDGYTLTCLCGNHEEALINAYYAELNLKKGLFRKEKNKPLEAWIGFGGGDTMQSYGIENMKDFPADHLKWFESLKFYHETDKYLLVHAGFNFAMDNIFEDTVAMKWVRDFDTDYSKTGGRKVIHGHVPVNMELIRQTLEMDSFKFIDLDNGCYYNDRPGMGNLVALDIDSKHLWVQKNIEKSGSI